MRIEVTQADIDKATPTAEKVSFDCPIDLAASRAFGKEMMTGFHAIYSSEFLKEALPMKVYHLPEDAARFAWRFSYGKSVEPIIFEVEEL